MSGSSLELAALTKRYGATLAVDKIDLKVPADTYCCLLGPSGCGKTSTLRIVAGHEAATSGDVLLGAANVTDMPPARRGTAMMFQSYALFPHLSAVDNVAFSLKMRGVTKRERRGKAMELLRLVDMGPYAERLPAQLSGGQQQRVALARALIVEPETLLLDEPLSNLDANLREEMRFEVRRLHDQYRYTTVYVTHDQAEAMTTADLIAVMNAGTIEQAGSPEEIYDRPRSEFVARFIGASNILRGRGREDGRVEFAGVALRCAGARPALGREAAVSIRPHDIRLLTAAPEDKENVVSATVTRQVFLGASRDYMVAVAGGKQLRVITPAGQSVAPGSPIWLELPPERCRALIA